jgi:hypothetical protein
MKCGSRYNLTFVFNTVFYTEYLTERQCLYAMPRLYVLQIGSVSGIHCMNVDNNEECEMPKNQLHRSAFFLKKLIVPQLPKKFSVYHVFSYVGIHYRVHNVPQLVTFPIEKDRVHTHISFSFKIRFNLSLCCPGPFFRFSGQQFIFIS